MEPVSPFPLKTHKTNKSLLFVQATALLALTGLISLCSHDSSAYGSASRDQVNGLLDLDKGDFFEGDVGRAPNQDSEKPHGLQMHSPSYGGSGCPQGSATAVLSPDGTSLSVLFDEYQVEVQSREERQSRSCEIRIPFSVPLGYAVQIVKMEYRGFTSLARGARSTFGAGFRFEASRSSSLAQRDEGRVLRAHVMQGEREGEFMVSSYIPKARFSQCGEDFTLVAESYLNVMANRSGDQSFSMIDSMDSVHRPVRYALRWRRCGGSHLRPPVVPGLPSQPPVQVVPGGGPGGGSGGRPPAARPPHGRPPAPLPPPVRPPLPPRRPLPPRWPGGR